VGIRELERSQKRLGKLSTFLQTNSHQMQDISVDRGQCPLQHSFHSFDLQTYLLCTIPTYPELMCENEEPG
jgi:hypothetical protein